MDPQLTHDTTPSRIIVEVSLRPELIADLDAEVLRRQEETPWMEISRADLLREGAYKLLDKALTKKAAPVLQLASEPCQVCNAPMPKGNKSTCGKEKCQRTMHNQRKKERRQATRANPAF